MNDCQLWYHCDSLWSTMPDASLQQTDTQQNQHSSSTSRGQTQWVCCFKGVRLTSSLHCIIKTEIFLHWLLISLLKFHTQYTNTYNRDTDSWSETLWDDQTLWDWEMIRDTVRWSDIVRVSDDQRHCRTESYQIHWERDWYNVRLWDNVRQCETKTMQHWDKVRLRQYETETIWDWETHWHNVRLRQRETETMCEWDHVRMRQCETETEKMWD